MDAVRCLQRRSLSKVYIMKLTLVSLLCLCQLLRFGVRNAAEGFVREGTVHGNVLFFLRQHAIYVHVIIIEKI